VLDGSSVSALSEAVANGEIAMIKELRPSLLAFPVLLFALGCAALVTGCAKPAEQPAHTVSYFREHANERAALVKKCADDPGTLGQTPACMNAMQAEADEGIGSTEKLPPMNLSGKEPPPAGASGR
jgi:hypothetical protein